MQPPLFVRLSQKLPAERDGIVISERTAAYVSDFDSESDALTAGRHYLVAEKRCESARLLAGCTESAARGPGVQFERSYSSSVKTTGRALLRKLAKDRLCPKKRSKTFGRLEQAKNYYDSLPDAPVQKDPGLHESTAGRSGTGKRRRSLFWKLGQGVACRRDQPEFVFCTSHVAQTESEE